MAGWIRVEVDAHERRVLFLRSIPVPLDPDTARDDLRMHQDRRLGPAATPFPSLRELADRWGWSKSAVERLLAHGPASWSDPARLAEWVVVFAKSPGTEPGQNRDRTGTKRTAPTPTIATTRDRTGTEPGQNRDSTTENGRTDAEQIHPSPSPSPSQKTEREIARDEPTPMVDSPKEQPAPSTPARGSLDETLAFAICQEWQTTNSEGKLRFVEEDRRAVRRALTQGWAAEDIERLGKYFASSAEFQPRKARDNGLMRWSMLLNDKREQRRDLCNAWYERGRVDLVEAATGPPGRNGHKPLLFDRLLEDRAKGDFDAPF